MDTKDRIRKRMKSRRAELSRKEVYERSDAILQNLLSVPGFFRADTVHAYISSKNNEADTHELVRLLLKQRKRVVVPVADRESGTMRHAEIRSLSELVGGDFGILVPRMVRPVPADALQAVVVPALAADRRGHRVGYGAGFYDRFLAGITVPTFVLAYDFQLIPQVPNEPTDVPVSFVVTEEEVIPTRNLPAGGP